MKSNNIKTLKVLLSFIKEDKKILYISFIFSLINAIAYIGGSFLIGFIVNLIFEPIAKGDVNPLDVNEPLFWGLVTSLLISYLIYAIFRYLENRMYVKISFNATSRLRNNLIQKLHKLPISYYDSNKTGDLISSLIVDVNNIANSLYQSSTQIINALFNITISIVFMSFVSFALTIIVIPLSILMFIGVILLIKKSQPYFIKVQETFGELNAFVEEMLSNTKVTNVFNQQDFIYKQLQSITKKIRDISFKGDIIVRSFETIYYVISNSIILIITVISALFYLNSWSVLGIPGLGADSNGKATAALIFTFISLNWNFIGPTQSALGTIFSLQVGIASTTRVMKILVSKEVNRENEKIRIVKIKYDEKSNSYIETNKQDLFGFYAWKKINSETNLTEYKSVKGKVEFENVYFKYNEYSEQYQLKNASFVAEQGKVIAIVGPTGAGKTTIINLITKYYDYEKGSIRIDGNELKEINSDDLRDILTIVLQDSFLFNETILENLKTTNPDASFEEINQATELTQAHHFIQNMENGYDTLIENNGMNISQGQRQLLSLSRAILSNRNILILDEATSNIDSSTERIVQKSMLHLMQHKTCFVIAHRLSTIKNADLILVVNEGKIIESGSHQELLDQNGFYTNLYHSQFGN
ncbi:ABC transporter ATP-binding protein [Mycoplasmopsis felis]|uniref:ABC transporter n=1 Tax=Mycoplasmopsis felis TaxID=33923 RepID=A0A809S8T1_9BACT|nr:ABC transporter ATP-binding protein [Mycoplasmopsis felis]BBU47594.1 ABC transporter [Mycoplasmopsis felis]